MAQTSTLYLGPTYFAEVQPDVLRNQERLDLKALKTATRMLNLIKRLDEYNERFELV